MEKTDRYMSFGAVGAAAVVAAWVAWQMAPQPKSAPASEVSAVLAAPVTTSTPAVRTTHIAKPKPIPVPVSTPSPSATPYNDAAAFLAEADGTNGLTFEQRQQMARDAAAFADHDALAETTRYVDSHEAQRNARNSASGTRRIFTRGFTSGDEEEASAVCRDGTRSYSATRSGTCSGHGGVRKWL